MAFGASVHLTDEEMDQTYAEGFVVHLDITLDVVSDVRLVADQILSQGGGIPVQKDSPPPARDGNLDGARGRPAVNLQNVLSLSGNALQNSRSLLNVIVQGGSVGIGVNLQVIINPSNSTFNISTRNFNFSNIFRDVQRVR